MALLESDKRYTTILEKAQEKEWSNEECHIHFDRTAAKLNDQISHIHIPPPTPHSANAIVPDSDYSNPALEGEEGEDTEGTYYYPNQTPDSDSEEEQGGDTEEDNQQQQPSSSAQEIAAAQKWIEEERARRVNRKQREHTQRPCLRYSEGRNCYYDPCPFSHFIGPDAAHNPLRLPPATPAAAPTPAGAELHKTHSHEANMVIASWAKGTSVTIDTRLTNGIANIHTTVLSSRLVKQPNGKSPRFYSVALPTAYLSQLHEQFAYMADSGIHEDFLKVRVTAPQAPVAKPPTQLAPVAQPTKQLTLPTNTCNSVTSTHKPIATQPHAPNAALNPWPTQTHTPSAAHNQPQPHTHSAATNPTQYSHTPSAAHNPTQAHSPSAAPEPTHAAATTTTNPLNPLSTHLLQLKHHPHTATVQQPAPVQYTATVQQPAPVQSTTNVQQSATAQPTAIAQQLLIITAST